MTTPPILRAHDVPDLRDNLRATCERLVRAGQPEPLTEEMEWLLYALDHAALWYVSDEMTELLAHAWPSLPPTTLTPDLPPDEYGMVAFGHPVVGTAADHDGGLVFDGYVWGPAIVARRSEDHFGVALAAFQRLPGTSIVGPLGHSDWEYGMDTDTALVEPGMNTDQRWASMVEDHRIMASFWLMATEPNVATVAEAPLPRPVRRRAERSGRRVPTVRLIDVRRPQRPTAAPAGHREVEWSHRWLVRGHWRQQAYGEGRQLRRPTWIAPFVKGPEDKPFVVTEDVKVWRQ